MSDSENTCTCVVGCGEWPEGAPRYFVKKCSLCQQAPALKAENERLREDALKILIPKAISGYERELHVCWNKIKAQHVVIQTMLDALIVAEQRLSSDLSKTIKSQCCAAIKLATKTIQSERGSE